MNRRGMQALTAAFVAGAAAFGFAPLAYGSTEATLLPSVEAWYQPNPSCLSPAGCVAAGSLPITPPAGAPSHPAANPYPTGTLHVAVSAGMETARSYLRFPFDQLGGKTINAATLEIPLDVNPQDGNFTPQTSKVLVCATNSSNITASEGTTDPPPANDCTGSAPMTYVAKPQPHLAAPLGAMAANLPSLTGLVLLPDATKTARSDAWSVVFSAHTRKDAAKTAPAKVTVTYQDGTTSTSTGSVGTGGSPALGAPAVAQPGIGIVSGPGTSFAAPPPIAMPPTTAVAPTVDTPMAQPPVTSTPQLITVGYAYPGVWLLPLGFLILIPLTVRALTQDLSGNGRR